MKSNLFKTLTMSFFATAALTACGQGFSTSTPNLSSNSQQSTNGVSSVPDEASALAEAASQVNGTISGGQYDGTPAVHLDPVAKTIVLSMPMPLGATDISALSIPVTKMPGTTIGMQTDASGNTDLVLTIPLTYVLHGVNFMTPSALPNGQPLPSIPDGELPSLAVQLNTKTSTTLYLSQTVVGLYIASSVNPYIGLTLPIRSSDGIHTLGYFSTVPAVPGYQGGVFISFSMPNDLAALLDDYM